MEKRDFYLNTIKHLEFRSLDEEDNSDETKKLMNTAIEEIKKVETEIKKLLQNS